MLEKVIFDRANLLTAEERLCQLLAPFFAFAGHALYFPRIPLAEAELLSPERRLLAPVRWRGKAVAALRLDGVRLKEARRMRRFIPKIISLCLETIALENVMRLDSATGLFSETALLEQLAERLSAPGPLHQSCLGLIVLEWPDAELIAKRAGPQTVALAWEQMAEQLRKQLPEGAIAASIGRTEWRHEFAILMNATGRGSCHGVATRAIERLELLDITDPFSSGRIPVLLSGGHALFPQDLTGPELSGPAASKALLLRDRARLASKAARKFNHRQKAMAFAWICQNGGMVTKILPDGQLAVSLGRNCQAQKDMRFHIISPGQDLTASKAQIVLTHVGAQESVAAILHLEQAGNPPEIGDQLLLARQSGEDTGNLLAQAAFLDCLAHPADGRFSLSITRFTRMPDSGQETTGADFDLGLKRFLGAAIAQLGEFCSAFTAGFYGIRALGLYLPNTDAAKARKLIERLHELAAGQNLAAATGIFVYPCLNFARKDSEECALKALEYAELLPAPHIGFLDALALAISADKRFSQGDELGALAEYRLALLLKPHDAMIMNSLGVCLGALNRVEDAAQTFETALRHCDEKELLAKICYNLGNIHNRANDLARARHYFRHCIKTLPEHIFAWLRLGQIHAKTGRNNAARALYNHACKLAADDAATLNMVERHLARLDAATSQLERARERLHDSLLRDPADSASMLLLAETYLEDDPSMAELLARKGLRLGADAFDILAKALAAQGRHEESELAGQRAQCQTAGGKACRGGGKL